MPGNPKVLRLIACRDGMSAAFVWLCSLAYAGEQGTDGFIPKAALPRINGKAAHARLLVEHGFWKPLGDDGWLIHDWAEFQVANLDMDRLRLNGSRGGHQRAANMTPEERSESAREAARKRWKHA